MNIEIVQSTMRHAKDLSETLREQDKEEALAIGVDPKKAPFYAFRHGLWRRTGLVDGNVAAMWGLAGSVLGLVGQPYLMTGEELLKVPPLRVAKIYKEEVQLMRNMFPILENYVDSRYIGAIRLLKIAGFKVTGPVYMPSGLMFYKFRMET